MANFESFLIFLRMQGTCCRIVRFHLWRILWTLCFKNVSISFSSKHFVVAMCFCWCLCSSRYLNLFSGSWMNVRLHCFAHSRLTSSTSLSCAQNPGTAAACSSLIGRFWRIQQSSKPNARPWVTLALLLGWIVVNVKPHHGWTGNKYYSSNR